MEVEPTKQPMDTTTAADGEEEEGDVFDLKRETRVFDAALFGETVRKGFSKLFSDQATSDIILLLGTEKLYTHRMVLCAWSETFRAMLEGTTWVESAMKELPVHIEEDEHEVFREMIKYMYTGAADFIDSANVVNVIALANYYGIHSLKEVCGKLLGARVSAGNLFYLLDIVDKFDCRELELMCGQFLAGNFTSLWEIDDSRLLSLRPETWVAMLKSDDLAARSEKIIYDAVMAYANHNAKEEPEKRDSTLVTLMPLIRWNYLPPAFLMETVENDTTLMHLPITERLLYEVYRFAACPIVQPSFCTRPRTGFQRFDADHKGHNIKLGEDMCLAETTHSGWETVRCLIPLTNGAPYIEFEVEASSNMMLGVAEEECSLNSYAGEHAKGHVLHGSDGNFYSAGNSNQKNMTFSTGDKVGIYADLEAGSLTYFKNSKKSFVYTSIPKHAKVYPCASFAGSNKVKINPTPEIPEELTDILQSRKGGVALPKPTHS